MAEVFSSPLAIIRAGSNGTAIGKIRNLSFQENIQRANVQGLGALTLSEVPATLITCNFNASTYAINMKKFGSIKDPFWPTDATGLTQLINSILMGETGVQLHIYRRVPARIPQNFTAEQLLKDSEVGEETIAIIQDCFLTTKSFEISEGQVAGKTISGVYLTPVWNTGR